MSRRPTYLKLGGALLTRKDQPEHVRTDVLERLCLEIARWRQRSQEPIVVSHGSGSFAHLAVRTSGFLDRRGDPLALARVAAAARRLDVVVCEALVNVGVPALPVPGSLLGVCRDGAVVEVHSNLVTRALDHDLVPVLYGDAAIDEAVGGAVASTEPLLVALARHVPPRRVVLATDVDGVFETAPDVAGARPLTEIDAPTAAALGAALAGAPSGTEDVTGGMGSKVRMMLELAERMPGLEIRVLSGLRPGAVEAALEGRSDAGGTLIRAAS